MAGFSNVATNSFFVWGMRTSKPFKGLQAGRSVEFTNEDTEAIRREVASVAVVSPRAQLGGHRGSNMVVRGAKSSAFSIMGDHPEIFTIQSQALQSGRFINPTDIREARKVAVIGTRPLEVLFAKGKTRSARRSRSAASGSRSSASSSRDRAAAWRSATPRPSTSPSPPSSRLFNFRNRVQWFAVTSKPGIAASAAQEDVLALLRARHQIAPDDKRAIGGFNLEEQFGKIQALRRHRRPDVAGRRRHAGGGAIGVSNIMLIIVRERTKEIGLRRAVGATPLWIMAQIVVEAVILTSTAGLLGLCAGARVMGFVASFVPATAAGGGPQMFQNPGVSFGNAVQAVAILVAAGTLAGLAPAQRAIAVTPVVALRTE